MFECVSEKIDEVCTEKKTYKIVVNKLKLFFQNCGVGSKSNNVNAQGQLQQHLV